MDASPIDQPWSALTRVHRTIVVADVVESVRLMQANEADVIDRWRRFVNEVVIEVLPLHAGRLVKSLGDGLMLEFTNVPSAIRAALEMHRRIDARNEGRTEDAAMLLRIGVHVADVVVDALDVYGAGVNLAARLSTLAGPGETVVSLETRDSLVPDLDADIEDMGECWVKHVNHPVRAYRLRPSGAIACAAAEPGADAAIPMVPTIAVVPFDCLSGADEQRIIGDLIADGVIAHLSPTTDLRVVSRLSTSAFRGRDYALSEIGAALGATYVLSGAFAASGDRLVVTAELADTRNGKVVWADRQACLVGDLLRQPSDVLDSIADSTHRAITLTEARRTLAQPLPSLASYSLLVGSVGLLHRSAPRDFTRAREALVALSERVPRHGSAYAWMAKWHCLRLIRGQAGSPEADRSEARWRISQALERDPSSSLAWALSGLVHGFLDQQLDRADEDYRRALSHNPNEPLAWLYVATLRSWQGRGPEAASAAQHALRLSPLDPMRYYFESLAAAGFLADQQYERSIALCQQSLRLNRGHTPTYRVLAISQILAGHIEDGKRTVSEMLTLQPDLTVTQYLSRYPGQHAAHALMYAEALRVAGLPAQ